MQTIIERHVYLEEKTKKNIKEYYLIDIPEFTKELGIIQGKYVKLNAWPYRTIIYFKTITAQVNHV